ncbi:hypothetical protein PENTCL1PPCAC_24462, partial [Pristionchus entomophagus]
LLLFTMIGAALRGGAHFLGDDPRPRSADDSREYKGLIRSGLIEVRQSSRTLETERKLISRSGIIGQALAEYADGGWPAEYRPPHALLPRRPSSAPKTGLIGAWLRDQKERGGILPDEGERKRKKKHAASTEDIPTDLEEYRPAFLEKRLKQKTTTPAESLPGTSRDGGVHEGDA